MIDEGVLNIYTDGSSKTTPRRGGVGIRFIYIDASGTEIIENLPWPGYMGATGNEMEIKACILALKNAPSYLERQYFKKILIYTDSKYVVDNYKNAMFLWPKTKWLRKGGAPVLNTELWKDLVKSMIKTGKRVDIQKVKGHSDDLHNRAVDKLAKQSAMIPLNKPLAVRIVRRKKSSETTKIGSVDMLGQRITIRIVEGQYLKTQRLYRYRYEVMSKGSPYFGKVDFICSKELLHEAHTYFVRFNKDKNNPRLEKVFREIPSKAKSPQ